MVSEVLTPEEAAHKALGIAGKIPQMTVLGIAGPGDPLANPKQTFRTFELVAEQAPDIKLCLSSNGLMLPEYIDKIKELIKDQCFTEKAKEYIEEVKFFTARARR